MKKAKLSAEIGYFKGETPSLFLVEFLSFDTMFITIFHMKIYKFTIGIYVDID